MGKEMEKPKVLYVDDEVRQRLIDIPDEKLMEMSFNAVFQRNATANVEYAIDGDGFPIYSGGIETLLENITELQKECWNKFNTNPQISTAISDTAGSLCGKGFGFVSSEPDVAEFLEEFIYDSRNRLYSSFAKYVTRSEIEGELFLSVTLHEDDGFVEVDFMSPAALKDIYFHPNKGTMPLLYEFDVTETKNGVETKTTRQIPSIYVSEFPSLAKEMENLSIFDKTKIYRKHTKTGVWAKTNGYQTFIISWDKGLFTKRNVSSMRTTLEWANHYENLKRYEIDHKKSSGAYLWAFSFEDPKAFKNWLLLKEEERQKTGIMEKKTPGGSIILPPGVKLSVHNPNLPKISDSDTDIMQMVVSGLNHSEDMVNGSSSGTYGSVKASRGPESDRSENRKENFKLFLIHDFFKHVLRLHSFVKKDFKLKREREVVIDFRNKKEVMGKKKVNVWECVDITFPVSEISDLESRVKAYLGVKHGSLVDALGIPPSYIAEKLGFTGYKYLRMRAATEEKQFPDLISTVDSDALDTQQEQGIEKPKTEKEGDKKQPVKTKKGDKKKV